MDFQSEYDKIPDQLKAMIRANKNKEDMLITYLIETQFDKTQQILESAGVLNPSPCKKCYGRYREGFKYPDARMVDGELIKGREVPILCRCVYKQLEKREGKLLVDWGVKDGSGENKDTEKPIRVESGSGDSQDKVDK